MKETLSEEITRLLKRQEALLDPVLYQRFSDRLVKGSLTRDENPTSHFCVYTWPYNPQTKEVFFVHHKKAGIWLAPGGHIDLGETLVTTRNREAKEELGVILADKNPQPFMFSICDIEERPTQPCREHFDTWYLIETDGQDFQVDPEEFLETRWMSLEEADKMVTDPSNRLALEKLKSTIFS